VDYYESCQEGLGLDFALEVHATVRRVVEHPQAWPVLDEPIRRRITNRFPYGVLYVEEADGDRILILAVMHLHRKPGYWKDRVGEP
jgi:plasmid stabilization system protein ParE